MFLRRGAVGRWSATPRNRGQSNKTQGRTALKSGSGSLAVGSYIQRGSAPPPPLGGEGLCECPVLPPGA